MLSHAKQGGQDQRSQKQSGSGIGGPGAQEAEPATANPSVGTEVHVDSEENGSDRSQAALSGDPLPSPWPLCWYLPGEKCHLHSGTVVSKY